MNLPEVSDESPLSHGQTTPSTQFEGVQRLLMFTDLPAQDEDIGKIHAVVEEKLELANDEYIRMQTELAMVRAKYKNLKGRYNACWAKLETWRERQTTKICVCAARRGL